MSAEKPLKLEVQETDDIEGKPFHYVVKSGRRVLISGYAETAIEAMEVCGEFLDAFDDPA